LPYLVPSPKRTKISLESFKNRRQVIFFSCSDFNDWSLKVQVVDILLLRGQWKGIGNTFCFLFSVSVCDVRAAILTEVFPCFFLSCKANARV
jgi:hypothetical protein